MMKPWKNITVYDLLTMQAGSPECCNNVWFSRLEKDWEKNWLGQPKLKEDIGKVFHYDSGCSYTLSRIVTKVMGENCLSIMQKRVFDKLGFGKINWLTSPEGHNTGGWGIVSDRRSDFHTGTAAFSRKETGRVSSWCHSGGSKRWDSQES